MDNYKPNLPDGTPDKYFKGTLVFIKPDGTGYQVKQLSIEVPKDGMKQGDIERGNVANITIDLNDSFQVEKL